MKVALVISYVLIGVIAFVVIMQWKTLSSMNVAIEKLKASLPTAKAQAEASNPNQAAGDWLSELQNNVKDFELKFVSK